MIKESLLIGGLLIPLLPKGSRGSKAMTYDFSMLNDQRFNVRSMARYKKKFPRFRVMPKYMPMYDLYVFVFPFEKGTPVTITDTDSGHEFIYNETTQNTQKLHKILFRGDEIYPNFQKFYRDKFEKSKDIHIVKTSPLYLNPSEVGLSRRKVSVTENREIFLTEDQRLVFEEIKKLAQNPTNKILICNPNPDELFSPYMMLHELAETIIPETDWGESVDAEASSFVKIIKPTPRNRFDFGVNCILPRNKNFIRWLNNPKYWDIIKNGGYGFTGGDVNDNISDAFASLMSGKLSWLTPDNYPPLKHFILETNKDAESIIFPESYEPLIQSYEKKFMQIIEILNNNQIFIS